MQETITLPSNGLFYDEDFPINLTIRSLTTKEEQIIYGSTSDSAIDMILRNCIVEPAPYPIDALIPADKVFILYKLRILSYGQDYNQTIFCPFCNYEGLTVLDLDELPCECLDESKVKIPLKLTLPVSKDVVELRVLTEADYKSIKDRAQKVAKRLNLPFTQVEYKLRSAKQIKAINGEKVDSFKAEQYYDNMSVRDVRYIQSALNSLKVGYQGSIETQCPSCLRDIVVPFEMTSEFLSPTFRDFDWN